MTWSVGTNYAMIGWNLYAGASFGSEYSYAVCGGKTVSFTGYTKVKSVVTHAHYGGTSFWGLTSSTCRSGGGGLASAGYGTTTNTSTGVVSSANLSGTSGRIAFGFSSYTADNSISTTLYALWLE